MADETKTEAKSGLNEQAEQQSAKAELTNPKATIAPQLIRYEMDWESKSIAPKGK